MKKIFIYIITSLTMTPAFAHHGQPHLAEPIRGPNYYPRYEYHPYHQRRDWVAPAIAIGTVYGTMVASEIVRQNRENDRINNIPQYPVVIEKPVIIERQNETVCTEWREVQELNGRSYKERICRIR